LQIPENGPIDPSSRPALHTAIVPPSPVAPVWHTVVLIAGIALLSVAGAAEFSGGEASFNRLPTYALTAATELCMLAWVYFGLRLRKVPFRSLLGSFSDSFQSIAVDLGFAVLFWFASLMVLGTIGIFWTVIEASITHRSLFPSGKQLAPDPTQQQTIHTLAQLAPTSGYEVTAWILVCIIAGFVEEIVFRGYLHRQFTAWSRGATAAGVAFSALLFGGAHGYQGARNMVLLAVFGALFSLLALFRRSLRAGIFAHSWHDLFVGLMLALLKARHVV
jgi:membrane protease YdiL (CAAX protease family)